MSEVQLDMNRVRRELETHQHETNLRIALIQLYEENARLKAQIENDTVNTTDA